MRKVILLLFVLSSFAMAQKKVLYFTHEPGRWHKYAPQKAIFIQLAEKAGWDLTVSTGEHDPQIVALRNPELTKGYDAVIYNFCFAASKDLEAVSNVIAQTREKGVPAMVIHCAMHSFWGTFKNGHKGRPATGEAKPLPELVEKWNKENPGKDFPIWGDFTGVASTFHGPKTPIKVTKCCDHEATKSLSPGGYTTVNAELYNNFYVLDSVKPLLKGLQESYPKAIDRKIKKGQKLTDKEKNTPKNKDEAIVMWQVPQGKSEVIGLSLGHGEEEWNQPEFQGLLIDSVNYLLKK